jgi:hypothetical protein
MTLPPSARIMAEGRCKMNRDGEEGGYQAEVARPGSRKKLVEIVDGGTWSGEERIERNPNKKMRSKVQAQAGRSRY